VLGKTTHFQSAALDVNFQVLDLRRQLPAHLHSTSAPTRQRMISSQAATRSKGTNLLQFHILLQCSVSRGCSLSRRALVTLARLLAASAGFLWGSGLQQQVAGARHRRAHLQHAPGLKCWSESASSGSVRLLVLRTKLMQHVLHDIVDGASVGPSLEVEAAVVQLLAGGNSRRGVGNTRLRLLLRELRLQRGTHFNCGFLFFCRLPQHDLRAGVRRARGVHERWPTPVLPAAAEYYARAHRMCLAFLLSAASDF
jgi:hypothetical protein